MSFPDDHRRPLNVRGGPHSCHAKRLPGPCCRCNDGKPPWTFIGGEIEPGESPADAGIREVKEETGLQVEADQELGRRVHPGTGRTMIYMAARPTHGTDIFVGDRDELAEVRWVTLPEADQLNQPDCMFGPVRDYLARTFA